MDAGLLAWGRAVKQRQRSKFPVLWLFTDAERLPDPLPAIALLPRGLCGVVFRHDQVPGRQALATRVARLCRQRHLSLVVAGDARLAASIGAGIHLRAGRWPEASRVRRSGLVTSSAHDVAELRRARQAGAEIIFLSPTFKTASHAGKPGIGAVRWAKIASQSRGTKVYSLGGITGKNIDLLPRFCGGVGAITALIPQFNSIVT